MNDKSNSDEKQAGPMPVTPAEPPSILIGPEYAFAEEDVRELVAGARGKMVYATGDADEGILSAGQVQGLIHDIPTCAELVSRIMRDAEAIIRSRLEGMMSGAQRQAAE